MHLAISSFYCIRNEKSSLYHCYLYPSTLAAPAPTHLKLVLYICQTMSPFGSPYLDCLVQGRDPFSLWQSPQSCSSLHLLRLSFPPISQETGTGLEARKEESLDFAQSLSPPLLLSFPRASLATSCRAPNEGESGKTGKSRLVVG
jgi:hypothetical protein